MAEFSKEYCEKYMDFEGYPFDFSIRNELDKLDNNEKIAYICEGYGFTHIAKHNNKEYLIFNGTSKNPIFVEFDKLDNFILSRE